MKKTSISLPIIGISGSLLTIESGTFKGRERVFVGHDYVKAILQAGGIPIVLPVIDSQEAIAQQMELIDGLLLSGGCDVHPHLYQEEPHPLLEDVYPARDVFELALIQEAVARKMPILGICRGLQVLNVAFGGTLYQDLSLHSPSVLKHSQKAPVDQAIHTVDLEEGTVLQKICNQASICTNSIHHQSIKALAKGFKINAMARDGIIEGIEKMDQSFILGLQWHPELMHEKDALMLAIFRTFIEAAHQGKPDDS